MCEKDEWLKSCPTEAIRTILASLVMMKRTSPTSTIKRLVIGKDEESLEELTENVQKELTRREEK